MALSRERRQLLRLVLLRERIHDLIELAVHDGVDLVQRQVDPVVRHAALRKIVRADALAAIARADERLAVRGFLVLALAALAVEQAGGEHAHRLRTVAVLRTVVLAFDHEAGGQVRDADRRIGLVDVLAARARGAKRIDADVCGIDRDVGNRIGLGNDRDRARRSVDAPLRLRLGHALHAVAAGFELEPRVGALTDDAHDHFPVAAELARRRRDDLGLPAVPLGVAHVHAQQIAGEQSGFVAAGAGADLEEHVALVVGIAGQQRRLQFAFQCGDPHLRRGALLVGERAHRRIVREFGRRREIGLGQSEFAKAGDHGTQVRMLLGQRAIAVEVARDVRRAEEAIELVEACGELVELGTKRRFHRIGSEGPRERRSKVRRAQAKALPGRDRTRKASEAKVRRRRCRRADRRAGARRSIRRAPPRQPH